MWSSTAGDGDQRRLGDGGHRPVGTPDCPVLVATQIHGRGVLLDPLVTGALSGVTGQAGTDGPEPWSAWTAVEGDVPVGDALVSRGRGRAVAVRTADCAPLAIGTPDGAFAAVHVGWRGLVAGVVEAVASTLVALGAHRPVALLGPTIGPCCYQFSEADLATVLHRTDGVGRSTTRTGEPALDLVAAVQAVATACGMTVPVDDVPCTGCGGPYFSHRARRDEGRLATVVWHRP